MRLKYMFYTILKLFVVWLYYLNPLRRASHTFIFFFYYYYNYYNYFISSDQMQTFWLAFFHTHAPLVFGSNLP